MLQSIIIIYSRQASFNFQKLHVKHLSLRIQTEVLQYFLSIL